MLALWILPLLVVAPLFSRDVFSYAAQGEMMSHHINPYHYGPGTLGSGPYVNGVDPLWANTPAPYGPLFLMLAGWSATLSLHHALVTVVLLRLQSVAGIALIAYCIPKLARSFGRDPGPAFVLAVLNPLTLLALVGGAHNDAIMVGLLLAGVTAARSCHPVVGCRSVRAGRLHQGSRGHRHRLRGVGVGGAGRRLAPPRPHRGALRPHHRGRHGGVVAGVGPRLGLDRQPGHSRHRALVDGAGHRRSGCSSAGPPTSSGIGVGLGGVLTLTRAIGLIAAAVIAVYCLRNRERIGLLGALGATMMAFVLLGPVVQPWYLTWGIIIVAPIVTGRWLYAVLGLSAVAPFIGLTGGADLLERAGAHGPGQHGPGRDGALGRGHRPARQLDDVVADRPLASADPAAPRARRSNPERRPSGTCPGRAYSSRCSSTTSSHWRCLRPTSRSTPDQLEARSPVQGDGGLVVPGDPGDHRVEAVGGGQDEQLVEESLADPPAPLGTVDVDGVLGGGRVPRALTEGRERAETQDNLAVGPDRTVRLRVRRVGGHQGRMDPAVLEDPGLLLGPGPGHHVERVRALENLDVVDRPDGFGVGHLGESDPHPPMVLLTCENLGSGGSRPRALAIIDRFADIPAAPL